MSQIIDILYQSEKIVKTIGSSVLPNGKTISQVLTINNVPYWDVFASELASRYIPAAFGEPENLEFIGQLVKPNLVKTRNFIRDINQIRKNRNKNIEIINLNNILCLEFMPAQSRDVMRHVTRYLADHKGINTFSLGDKEWPSHGKKIRPNENRKIIWDFWSDELNVKAKNLGIELKSVKKYILNSRYLEQSLGEYEPSFTKKIKHALNRLFVGELPSLIRQGIISSYILKQYQPSLLIVTDVHDPRTRMYILQCNHLNIPCLALQHGLTNSSATEWRFFTADRVAVWGNHFKKILGAHGIASNKIIVTGAPRSDSLIKTNKTEGQLLKKKLGIPERAHIILLASTFSLSHYDGLHNDSEILERMKRAIFASMTNLKNTFLIVKPHPYENENETKSFSTNNTNIIFIDKKEDIKPLTKVCDCFVAFNSTTTIDAILLNKLVVCPAFPGWVWNDTYGETNIVYSPASIQEISDIFKLVSNSSHLTLIKKHKNTRKKLISDWLYQHDGMCAERIGNIALSMQLNKNAAIT